MTQKLIDKFQHVYIHRQSVASSVGERFLNLFPAEKISIVEDRPPIFSKGEMSSEQYALSKKILFITPFAGSFFKRCPGAKKGLACCNYFVLNLGQQCDMDCSYCYLQSFLNTPYSVIYSNIDMALTELGEMYRENSQMAVRVGTGEVIDSLSLDPLTLYSHTLIDFFKDKPKWNLEFKTKSASVDQFIDQPHSGNVIVSWSINPQYIVENEEHGTASLDQRLQAARRCFDKGFRVAFHIDPVVWHPEWQDSYRGLAAKVAEYFQPADLPYISLGALRFQSEQKEMMRERFGMKSWINRAEMFKSAGGKMRYDQRLREDMFKFIINSFKDLDPQWKIFLCMETPETWINTTGSVPFKQQEIQHLFKPISAPSLPNI
jgi:spore photoproduct lyase